MSVSSSTNSSQATEPSKSLEPLKKSEDKKEETLIALAEATARVRTYLIQTCKELSTREGGISIEEGRALQTALDDGEVLTAQGEAEARTAYRESKEKVDAIVAALRLPQSSEKKEEKS